MKASTEIHFFRQILNWLPFWCIFFTLQHQFFSPLDLNKEFFFKYRFPCIKLLFNYKIVKFVVRWNSIFMNNLFYTMADDVQCTYRLECPVLRQFYVLIFFSGIRNNKGCIRVITLTGTVLWGLYPHRNMWE